MAEQPMAAQAQQMMRGQGMSSIKEVLAGWNDVARLLRGGESGSYEDWTKDELAKRARELDIEGRSTMTKDELIEALRNH